MKKFDSKSKNIAYLLYRWTRPLFDLVSFTRAVPGYFWYARDYLLYRSMANSEQITLANSYPILTERTTDHDTAFDRHYFYQGVWATRKVKGFSHNEHVDVGSQLNFVGGLSAIKKVTFIDIRPVSIQLPNFFSKAGDLLSLPYRDNEISSLSCLHVVEHVGLGRYGDKLDPEGSKKACKELQRVLAPGGDLLFSGPIGKSRICFNAHRIHSTAQIIGYFNELQLVELSGITDSGDFLENINVTKLESSDFACGLFHFKKPQ